MKTSLIPLIISLTLIVLLTAIIVNNNPEMSSSNFLTPNEEENKRIMSLDNTQAEPNVRPVEQEDSYTLDRKGAIALLLQAFSDLDKGKVKQAEGKVKTILVFEPENLEALSLLGKIFYLQHKYKEAEMIFRRLVQLNASSSRAYNNLGQVLMKQNKTGVAVTHFRMAQRYAPDSGLIALNLAGAYAQAGKIKEAIIALRKAYSLLGDGIVAAANHPDLDNIRTTKAFREIMSKAYKSLADKRKRMEIFRKSFNGQKIKLKDSADN